ncbi:MAG: hypothetical protein ABJE66_08260 [Deltaproteobacteria bacterium]
MLLVMLAGCRFEFAEHHDATPPVPDAPPIALACNTPVRLGDGAGSELAATATATRVLATWLDPNGMLRSGGARISAEAAIPFAVTPAQDGAFVHVGIAADANRDQILGVATDATGGSFLSITDDATLTIGAVFPSTIALTGAHGVAATGVDTPAWVIAGNDIATAREQAAGVSPAGTIGPPLDSGQFSARTTLVPFDSRIALIDVAVGNNCDVKTMNAAITTNVNSVGWGTNGQCTQATAAFSPGRTEALLVRHDLTDIDLNHVIATINANGTLTVPGESKLGSLASEARGVGVTDGYSVLFEDSGMLDVIHVGFAGAKEPPIVLGPVPSATGHDLVLFGGEPYAIWLGDGLQLARICQ